MTPSQTPSENNLQPFFILHKALPKKQSVKTRRKIDLDLPLDYYQQLRVEAFDFVWSNVHFTIKNVLRDININVFTEIYNWVRDVVNIGLHGKIFTGLVLTKNVEFVDDLLTFKELNLHLKLQGCHVVNLSSLDFNVKNGIGGCVTSLLRQLVGVDNDVSDMTVLGSWYSEAENYDKPLVVIVDDMERCNGNVLSDFVLLLSEWVIKVPIVLVMGVATTVDAPRSLLRANALCRLQPCKFALGSPADKLYAVAEAVVLRSHCGFDIGYKVAVFLRNYFLRQDGTVTSFIRALKIACAKHFVMEPLSFLCKVLVDEDSQGLGIEKLPASMLDYAFGLPSCQTSKKATPVTAESLASGLIEMKKLRKNWCSVLVCLYEAAKFQNIQFLDILCEALDPSLYSSRASPNHKLGKAPIKPSSINHCLPDGEYSARGKGGLIFQVIRKVKDLPVTSLFQLLQVWGKHSEEIADIHGKVKELQSMLKIEDDSNNLQCDETGTSKSPASRCHMNKERDRSKVNEKAAVLLECMIRGYLTPIESAPFHEIVCFKHVDVLQSALIGDPRKMIQVDLLKSHNYLHCSCCTKNGSVLLPSMHDTSIMYTLAQEHGDLINLHDWFQSFKSTIFRSSTSVKRKLHSPSPKKRKLANEPEEVNNALVQARFCRAVMELQITGLLRMPSKRRPDYVQRVAFGL